MHVFKQPVYVPHANCSSIMKYSGILLPWHTQGHPKWQRTCRKKKFLALPLFFPKSLRCWAHFHIKKIANKKFFICCLIFFIVFLTIFHKKTAITSSSRHCLLLQLSLPVPQSIKKQYVCKRRHANIVLPCSGGPWRPLGPPYHTHPPNFSWKLRIKNVKQCAHLTPL